MQCHFRLPFYITNPCNSVHFNELSEISVWVKENIEDSVLVVDQTTTSINSLPGTLAHLRQILSVILNWMKRKENKRGGNLFFKDL